MQRELPERHRLGVWLPLKLVGRHPLQHPASRGSFLFQFSEQCVRDGYAILLLSVWCSLKQAPIRLVYGTALKRAAAGRWGAI